MTPGDSSVTMDLRPSDREGFSVHTVQAHEAQHVGEAQRITSIRSIVERLADEVRRPDPDSDLARTLAEVGLSGLRKLEARSRPFLDDVGS